VQIHNPALWQVVFLDRERRRRIFSPSGRMRRGPNTPSASFLTFCPSKVGSIVYGCTKEKASKFEGRLPSLDRGVRSAPDSFLVKFGDIRAVVQKTVFWMRSTMRYPSPTPAIGPSPSPTADQTTEPRLQEQPQQQEQPRQQELPQQSEPSPAEPPPSEQTTANTPSDSFETARRPPPRLLPLRPSRRRRPAPQCCISFKSMTTDLFQARG